MKYLVYCVFHTPGRRTPQLPPGVGGQPVFLVARNGLSAAASKIDITSLTPAIAPLLDYEKVIESIYRQRAVIPLRYGTVFDTKPRIAELLEEHGRQYEETLKELEGRVEMGIRVLLENPRDHAPAAELSGVAYLAVLRKRYAQEARLADTQQAAADEIGKCLSGLWVRSKVESRPSAGGVLLSLHFLVSRKSVNAFREVFRKIKLSASVGLLLSGPWPPYNFVSEKEGE